MKASKLIKQLESAILYAGDLEVSSELIKAGQNIAVVLLDKDNATIFTYGIEAKYIHLEQSIIEREDK
jgi:hypothetical protein